jgi:hypothetical protein
MRFKTKQYALFMLRAYYKFNSDERGAFIRFLHQRRAGEKWRLKTFL